MKYDEKKQALIGNKGLLSVRESDEITRKLVMLIEGECEGLGASKAAQKHGWSRQRYFQIRNAFREEGAKALNSKKRAPKVPTDVPTSWFAKSYDIASSTPIPRLK